jgi:hypothetical protein
LADFGVSTAIDGSRAAVVQWGFNATPSAFYLYDHTTGQQLSKVAISISETSYLYRFSEVNISGDLLLVGSQGEPVMGMDKAGRARLYDISNPAQPTEVLQLTAPVVGSSKNFGAEIELQGRNALIGAYGERDVPGAAYYYDLSDLNSADVRYLVPEDSNPNDFFGASLAMDGNIAIVGGFSGYAYLFDLSSGQQLAQLQSPGANFVGFGRSVDISVNHAIIWSQQVNAGDDNGAAHLYDISDPTNPVFLKTLIGSRPLLERGYDGRVAIDGAYAILSARSANSAYLFDISDLNNISEARLLATNINSGAEFGISIDIDGLNIIAGAWGQPVAGKRSGAAYVFRVPEPTTSLLLWPLLSVMLRRAHISNTLSMQRHLHPAT